jgi:hypothetical protein
MDIGFGTLFWEITAFKTCQTIHVAVEESEAQGK